MQGQRVRPGAQFQQQALGRLLQRDAGGVQGLPRLRILVGLDQQGLGRLRDGLGQLATGHLVHPLLLLFGLLALFLEGGECGGQDIGRRGTIASGAAAMKIRGRAMQAQHQRRLLDGRWGMAEIIGGERGGGKFFLRRAFPQKLQIDVFGQRGRGRHQFGGRGRVEREQHG